MIRRLLDAVSGASVRRFGDTMARGAALIVTDRRWGATLSASALGFGLFVGVAIGPGTAGTLATSPQQLLLPSLGSDGRGEPEAEAGGSFDPADPQGGGALAIESESSSLETFPSAEPLTTEPTEPLPPEKSTPKPDPEGTGVAEEEVETTALAGTVVHANPAAGSYVLAIKGGELVPVHATKLPRAGTKLSLEAVQLANGTFAEESTPKRKGNTSKASFRGVVTFVKPDPLAPAYTLSGRGASLLVAVSPDPAGALPSLPSVGSYATATVAMEVDGALVERELALEPGEPATYLDLAGVYVGISPETGQLLLSADDTRKIEQDLALTVPTGIDTTKLEPGDSYMATATVEPDGSLTLTGIASDERRKGADDPLLAQGDLKR
jgi:hypothetical protein